MSLSRLWAPLLGLALLSACDHDLPEAQPSRHARRALLDDCVANIEVYPAGRPLPQPYRVLGPIDGTWGVTSASRFKKMKKHACELGADAIIDEGGTVADKRVTTTYEYDDQGRPVAVVQESSKDAKRGAVAVQFVGPEVVVAEPAPQAVVVQAPAVVVPPPPVVVVPQGAVPQVLAPVPAAGLPPAVTVAVCPTNTEACGAVCCESSSAVCNHAMNACVRR